MTFRIVSGYCPLTSISLAGVVALKIEFEDRGFRAGTADQYITLGPVLLQYLVAMVRFAGKIGGQARAAIAELARSPDGDAMTLQHTDDRLADRDLVIAAAPCKLDAKRAVFVENPLRRRKIFAMDSSRRPMTCCLGGRHHQ